MGCLREITDCNGRIRVAVIKPANSSSGAPVDGFGVGSYISSAEPNDFTADLKQVEGKPLAKRGRIPGITDNPRVKQLI